MVATIGRSGSLRWRVNRLILCELPLNLDGHPDLTTSVDVITVNLVKGTSGRRV